MSMTREEAAKWLEETIQDTDTYFSSCSEALQKELDEQKEVFLLALSALRPVSREQVEKVWRGEWNYSHKTKIDGFDVVQCSKCGQEALTLALYVKNGNFCPYCGAPMTDEAVDMVMERMEALHGKT